MSMTCLSSTRGRAFIVTILIRGLSGLAWSRWVDGFPQVPTLWRAKYHANLRLSECLRGCGHQACRKTKEPEVMTANAARHDATLRFSRHLTRACGRGG